MIRYRSIVILEHTETKGARDGRGEGEGEERERRGRKGGRERLIERFELSHGSFESSSEWDPRRGREGEMERGQVRERFESFGSGDGGQDREGGGEREGGSASFGMFRSS